jgi:hypothetical protein
VPALPQDRKRRDEAILDYIAEHGVTRPANRQPKRRKQPEVSLDDLDLDLE